MERLHGKNHQLTVFAMAELGNTLSAQGDLVGSYKLRKQVLQISERLFPGSDFTAMMTLQLAGTVTNLFRILGQQNEFAAARKLLEEMVEPLERALETMERLHGKSHKDTLMAMQMLDTLFMFLCAAMSSLGDQRSACKIVERIVKAQERVLGPEHPNTLERSQILAKMSSVLP